MKKYFCFLSLVLPFISLSQTNLVQNPSFEELYTCDYEVITNPVENVIPGWYSLLGFPRYFNSECLDFETTSGNFYDELPHPPFDGNGIMVLNTLSPYDDDSGGSVRSYLQTKLKEPLVKGRLYYIEYFITQTDETEYTHSHYGVHFTQELQANPSLPLVNAPAIILDPLVVVDTITIKEVGAWVRQYHCFTVDTSYEVMMVGNFSSRNEISTSPSAGFDIPAVRTSYDHFLLAEVEPELTLDDFQHEICAGDCITISSNHSLIPGSFEWILPGTNQESSTDSIVTVCYDQAGVYDISLSVDHCSGYYENHFPNSITVREGINFTPPADPKICFGDETTISIPEQYTVLWDDGDTSRLKILSIPRTYHFELSEGICTKEFNFDLSYILKPEINEIELFACQNESINYQDQTFTSPTIVYDTLLSIQGCDSIHNIIIIEYFDEQKIELEGNIEFCPGKQTVIQIVSAHPFIQWDDKSKERTRSFEQGGIFTITAIDEQQCASDTIIEINVLSDVSVSAKDIIDLDFETSIPIEVNYTGEISNYNWKGNLAALSCHDCPFPMLNFPQAGIYEIEVSNQFGCIARDQLRITLNKILLYVPNAISKSTTNFENQRLYAHSNSTINYALKVFDRWGALIFSADSLTANDSTRGWNPKDYNPGVFIYTLEFLDENENLTMIKGDVTVLK